MQSFRTLIGLLTLSVNLVSMAVLIAMHSWQIGGQLLVSRVTGNCLITSLTGLLLQEIRSGRVQ